MIAALEEIEEEVEITTVCNAIGINRPTFYRRRRPRQGAADKPRLTPPRALSCEERTEVYRAVGLRAVLRLGT